MRPLWASVALPGHLTDVTLQWRAAGPITGAEALVRVSLSHNAHWDRHNYHVIAVEDTLLADHGSLYNRDDLVVDKSANKSRYVSGRRVRVGRARGESAGHRRRDGVADDARVAVCLGGVVGGR